MSKQRSSLTNEQKTRVAVGVGVSLALIGGALLVRAATSNSTKKKKRRRRRTEKQDASSSSSSSEGHSLKSRDADDGPITLSDALERQKGSKLPPQNVLYDWVRTSLEILVYGGKFSMKRAREIQACCLLLDPSEYSFEFIEMAIEWLKLFRRTEMQLHLQSNPQLVQYMNHPEVLHGLELREDSDLKLLWGFVEGLNARNDEQRRTKMLMKLEFALRMGKYELSRQMLHALSLEMELLKGTDLQLMFNATAMLGRWDELAEFGRLLLEKQPDRFELEHQRYVNNQSKFDAKVFYEIATTEIPELKELIKNRIPTDQLQLQTQLVAKFVAFHPPPEATPPHAGADAAETQATADASATPSSSSPSDSESKESPTKSSSPSDAAAEQTSSSSSASADADSASADADAVPREISVSNVAIKFRGAIVEIVGLGNLGTLLGCFTGDAIFVTARRDELKFAEHFFLKRRGLPDSQLFVGEHTMMTGSKTKTRRIEMKLGSVLSKTLDD